jgi:hypothetical protein
LSPEEKEYIQSIEFFTVADAERIKVFAHDASLTSYDPRMQGRAVDAGEPVDVDCYRDDKLVMRVEVLGPWIIDRDHGHFFKYPEGTPDVKILEPPEMQPFKLRFECGLNMQAVYTSRPLDPAEVNSYPEPGEWCDVVLRNRRNTSYVSDEEMRGYFKCPTAGEGESHYAMNPNCKPDSPADMVLLFETKAGWNQHGGVELFTFDNHDPKGGCVLLNDGTVKFIRTKEELQQLRWK